jgi:hypothetical protein
MVSTYGGNGVMGVYAGPAEYWYNSNEGRTSQSTRMVVQDGLVLNLDAGASTSYPGSGTSWTDLSGNGNNGTLAGGVGYSGDNGGSLSFNGVNDYVSITTGQDFNFGVGDFTIECWVNFSTINTNAIFMSKYLSWTSNLDFVMRFVASTRKISFYGGDGIAFNIETNDEILISQWYHYAASRIFGVTTTYLNGLPQNSHTGNVSIPNDRTQLRVGLSHDNDEPFNGRISNIKIYKGKGLTEPEVLQNFNALRSRFGI